MKFRAQQFIMIFISLFIVWTASLFPQNNDSEGLKEREYFISVLTNIADPV